MNRRGFLTAMAAAPVAALVAPAATPFVSTFPYGSSLSCGVPAVGIVEFGQSLYAGETAAEVIVLNDWTPFYWKAPEGWQMSGPTIELFGPSDLEDAAAYCDELIEVEA